MKKIYLSLMLVVSILFSFNQITFAKTNAASKPFISYTKKSLAWPTDVLVENYSGQSITVRFITIVSDDTIRVDPYPAARFFAQLLNQYYVYQVRVMLWDYYGRLFFDKVVGSVNRITVRPSTLNEKLSDQNVLIS